MCNLYNPHRTGHIENYKLTNEELLLEILDSRGTTDDEVTEFPGKNALWPMYIDLFFSDGFEVVMLQIILTNVRWNMTRYCYTGHQGYTAGQGNRGYSLPLRVCVWMKIKT